MSSSEENKVVEIKVNKEEAKKVETKAKTFWEKHRDKIMVGAMIFGYALLKGKIDSIEGRTRRAFKQVNHMFDSRDSYYKGEIDALFNNCDILKSDLINVASTLGYSGQYACTKVED